MIAIVNISGNDFKETGINKYQIRINQQVICEFEHYRKRGGLSKCLKDAAKAVEQHDEEEYIKHISERLK